MLDLEERRPMNGNVIVHRSPSPSRAVVMEMKMMSNVSAIMMCSSMMGQSVKEGVSDDDDEDEESGSSLFSNALDCQCLHSSVRLRKRALHVSRHLTQEKRADKERT